MDLQSVAIQAAQQNGVPPDFFLSLIGNGEGGFANPTGVSPKGAMGVGQLMPETARAMGVADPSDPVQNLNGAAKYAGLQWKKYGGDPVLAAAAYNAGPGAVDSHGGVPPYPETQAYVKRVTGGMEPSLPSPDQVLGGYGGHGAGSVPGGQGAAQETSGGGAELAMPSPDRVLGNYAKPAPTPSGSATGGTQPTYDAQNNVGRNPDGSIAYIGKPGGVGADGAIEITSSSNPDAIAAWLKAHPDDPANRQAAPQAQDTSPLGLYQARVQPAMNALSADFKTAQTPPQGVFDTIMNAAPLGLTPRNLKTAADAVSYITAPISAAADYVVGKPVNALSGGRIPIQTAGDVGSFAIPVAGEMREAALLDKAAEAAGMNAQGYRNAVAQTMATRNALAPSVSAVSVPAPQKLAAFDQAGVRPTMAAIGGKGAAQLAKLAAENPLVGGRTASALSGSIQDTAGAAARIAQDYGTPLPTASAGEVAQHAIQAYAKGTGANLPPDLARQLSSRQISFGDKASALYTRAERLIGDQQTIPLTNTQQAVGSVLQSFDSPALAQRFKNSVLEGIGKDINVTDGQISWRDAKLLRTQIRQRLMGDPTLSGTVNDAQVGQIYGALTQDMRDGASALGGPQAARAWDQANAFYRAGQSQIADKLSKVFDANSGEDAYNTIIRAASSTGGADVRRLTAAKRAMGDDWGDIAATAAQRLGSDDHGAFSVNRFVTNYGKLSDTGRNVLFGSRGGGGGDASRRLAALDNLAEVAGYQKNVEAAANHSNSGTVVQGAASISGLLNPHTMAPTAAGLGGLALTGEAMTNPIVVRAYVGLVKASRAGPAAVSAQAGRLRQLAQTYPRLTALSGMADWARQTAMTPSLQLPAAAAASATEPGQGRQ